jgi:hypothetical protein
MRENASSCQFVSQLSHRRLAGSCVVPTDWTESWFTWQRPRTHACVRAAAAATSQRFVEEVIFCRFCVRKEPHARFCAHTRTHTHTHTHTRTTLMHCDNPRVDQTCAQELGVEPDKVLISNKLAWKRVPLTTPEPTFEPGVWVNLKNDAVQDISCVLVHPFSLQIIRTAKRALRATRGTPCLLLSCLCHPWPHCATASHDQSRPLKRPNVNIHRFAFNETQTRATRQV